MHSSYLRHTIQPAHISELSHKIVEAIKSDRANGIVIDSIAVRGVSGCVMGGLVSYLTGIPLVIVRKELSHSMYHVEYSERIGHYAIVDDLCSSGKTIDSIVTDITKEEEAARLSVVYLYHDDEAPGIRHRGERVPTRAWHWDDETDKIYYDRFPKEAA